MTSPKYYVKNFQSPLSNSDFISFVEGLITQAVAGLITNPGAKAVIDFTIGATLSTSSQFTIDAAKLDLGITDDGSEIQIGDKFYPLDVVIDASITSIAVSGVFAAAGISSPPAILAITVAGVVGYVYSKFVDPITEDVLKTLDGKDMVQFFDASGKEKAGLIFPEGIPGSEIDAVKAFVNHPNTAIFDLIGGSIQVDTGLGIDTKYEIYNAASYQTIANNLGITLAEIPHNWL